MAGIPEYPQKKFYQKHWFVESVTQISSIIGGFLAISYPLKTLIFPDHDLSRWDFWHSLVSCLGFSFIILSACSKFFQARAKDKKEEGDAELDALLASLQIIHSLVRHIHCFPRNEYGRLRVTIHRVLKAGNGQSDGQIEQMFEYVGDNKVGRKGRRFSSRPGIVGKAIKERDSFAATRSETEHSKFINELKNNWWYYDVEAKKLQDDRKSWMAVPLFYKGGDVTGVVYLDSSEEDFFNTEVRNTVECACRGLAVFISDRY